ncbi:NAD(P)-binding protein [Candidatus Magnetaquicoccus inordinatus]|uniref:NAD(P)-binding protein n=1 Tax=Candidatus Magnetaquicoccus inordinatus TaxID=2496818 RepID=UPI00102BAE65|nr:NAD(P)-binding protein [Candidatus Magnetaquicoccus inordinatus]
MLHTNPIHRSAIEWEYNPLLQESGLDRIVAYGDRSGKCPTYVERLPPCSNACPAGEDIRGYHNLVRGIWKDGDDAWAAAFRRLTQTNPFPAVMGRVCPAPCQSACNRQFRDETIHINAVEQAIGEYAIEKKLSFPKPSQSTGKKMAVVGAGPGGLSCAYHLARRGHSVVIYEAQEKLGGMMRYGIMGYRVSRETLDAEIERIIAMGMEVRTGIRVGVDVTLEQLSKEYDAVFLAVGAQKGRALPIPGAQGSGVTNAIDFLQQFEKLGEAMPIGKKVTVIGDGDVAMDVARLALRLGAQASLISAVPREEMKCSAFEFNEAVAEGTQIHYLAGTVSVQRNGDQVTGLQCIKMVKKAKGEEGWDHPIPFFRFKAEAGTEFVIETDMVVASIGQSTDMTGLEKSTAGGPWLKVDHNQKIEGFHNLFGGGDAVQITLLTTAIGHGRKAAEAMDRLANGLPLPGKPPRRDVVRYEKLKADYFIPVSQQKRRVEHPQIVKGSWQEVLVPLTLEQAKQESSRCMSCGLCFECNQCMLFCPQHAITRFSGNPEGEVMFTYYEKCVGCHICAEVCPTGYIDMGMD